MITAERLRELLSYAPETGEFTWLRNRGAAIAGGPAGVLNALGYRVIRIDRRLYLAHRLAWLYVHGSWPDSGIDHANCERADNRIANLRQSTQQQNVRNSRRRIDNSTGHKGVFWRKNRGKFVATLKSGGRTVWLGTFSDKRQAAAAYAAAAQSHFGEFART